MVPVPPSCAWGLATLVSTVVQDLNGCQVEHRYQ